MKTIDHSIHFMASLRQRLQLLIASPRDIRRLLKHLVYCGIKCIDLPARIIIFLIVFSCASSSAADLAIGIKIKNMFNADDLIQKILVIDDQDRKTESEYAAAHNLPVESVKERFAATGEYYCKGKNGGFGQGSLVVKNDLVVTAAHIVYRDLDCNRPFNLKRCLFRVTRADNNVQEYQIANIEGTGLKCEGVKLKEEHHTSAKEEERIIASIPNDWALLRLKEQVEGIEAYKIDPQIKPVELEGLNVVAVGKSVDFCPASKAGVENYLGYPKHIGDCRIRKLFSNGRVLSTNCDQSHLTSGGALLLRHDSAFANVFVGVASFDIGESLDEARAACRKHRFNKVDFEWGRIRSGFITLQGEFLAKILELSPK